LTNAIQQNRYDQLLRRVGGIIGPGSKVAEVLSELFPMIDVENVPSELLILAGTRTATGGVGIGAEAAKAPKAQLFNPANSGHIVTITRVMFSVDATVIHRWGNSTAVFSGSPTATSEYTDSRNDPDSQPVAEIRFLSEATLANGANRQKILSNTSLILENENDIAILSPGNGWEIGTTDLSVTARIAIYWRERVAEASELSL